MRKKCSRSGVRGQGSGVRGQGAVAAVPPGVSVFRCFGVSVFRRGERVRRFALVLSHLSYRNTGLLKHRNTGRGRWSVVGGPPEKGVVPSRPGPCSAQRAPLADLACTFHGRADKNVHPPHLTASAPSRRGVARLRRTYAPTSRDALPYPRSRTKPAFARYHSSAASNPASI